MNYQGEFLEKLLKKNRVSGNREFCHQLHKIFKKENGQTITRKNSDIVQKNRQRSFFKNSGKTKCLSKTGEKTKKLGTMPKFDSKYSRKKSFGEILVRTKLVRSAALLLLGMIIITDPANAADDSEYQ